MKKSKVISVRVSDELSQILDEQSLKSGISKSDMLSSIISNSISKSYDNLSELEKILFKIKLFISEDYHPYLKINTPAIIVGQDYDGEYEGKKQILVGDDTIIREKDGKYYSYNLHDDIEPVWMSADEIVSYYNGMYDAYGIPSVEYGDKYHYMKGYIKTLSNLIEIEKEKLQLIEEGFSQEEIQKDFFKILMRRSDKQ